MREARFIVEVSALLLRSTADVAPSLCASIDVKAEHESASEARRLRIGRPQGWREDEHPADQEDVWICAHL